uniref:Ankyrin repeat domain-containing protein n=1 Tax=Anas platyrhynchos platyrhynchos TaxID=8840 RepID=A0A493TRI0_ANAPP
MAISNALFAKLRDFITLRLPPGFPVKIEIPIFHILNARITFGNLNGCDEPVSSLRHSPSSEAPSPSSDSSSVSSSSSLSRWWGRHLGRGPGGGPGRRGAQPRRPLSPRSVVPGVRDGPGALRGAAGVQRGGHPPGRPAGGRGRPAAVRHPAEPAGGGQRVRPGHHLGGSDQQQAGHPPHVPRGPPRRQDSPAHGSPPSPGQPVSGGGRGSRGAAPQLRGAAALGHGAVGAGAGGGREEDEAGGRGAAAHPAALPDRQVTPR